MDQANVDAVMSWLIPTKIKDHQSFLGFANYYRRFIDNYSPIVKPLRKSTGEDIKFEWTSDQDDAFNLLIKSFSSAPILKYFNFNAAAVVELDASDYALGTIISQYDDPGVLHPVAYHSQQLTQAEINYDTFDKELLGIVESFKVWRHYLIAAPEDAPTHVINNHHNLQTFLQNHTLSPQQYCRAKALSLFHFKIFHTPGRESGNPDALLRRPMTHI
jgi:hypothetical protein